MEVQQGMVGVIRGSGKGNPDSKVYSIHLWVLLSSALPLQLGKGKHHTEVRQARPTRLITGRPVCGVDIQRQRLRDSLVSLGREYLQEGILGRDSLDFKGKVSNPNLMCDSCSPGFQFHIRYLR